MRTRAREGCCTTCTKLNPSPRAEKEKGTAEGGGMGDLRIRRKKEQGREAGRYYEQCANRVRGFFPRPVASESTLSSQSSGPSFPSLLFLFIIQWGQEVLVN